MVKDFKGRWYKILEIRRDVTILECYQSGGRVTIRSTGWAEMGFIS